VALPIAAVLLAFPFLVRAPQATIVRVDPAAILGGDGASWDSAYNDLQVALTRSPSGSVFWCAKGNYKKIRIVKSCEIYGGFAGNEASLEERDWAANRTILQSLAVSSDALIDGVTFAFPPEGGEVSFNNADNPTLKNCRFIKTISGQATVLFDDCSNPSLINCALIDCQAGVSKASPLIAFRDCRDGLILNCTVADTKLAQTSPAVVGFRNSTGEVHNSILWNPGCTEIALDSLSAVKVSFCDIEGGYPGIGNVSRDPLLSSEYHLQPLSPCRDTASAKTAPEEDLDGDYRPFGPGSDIGADECLLPYSPSGTKPPLITPPARGGKSQPSPAHVLMSHGSPSPSPTPTVPPPSPSPTSPLIDEGFDEFHLGVRPSGWTFTNCNSDSDTYTSDSYSGRSIPSLRFDETGDQIVTKTFVYPYDLSFWIKGSSEDLSSSLLVEEYYSSAWNQVTDIYNLPTSGTTEGPFPLNPNSIQVRFSFSKNEANLAFDDVIIIDAPTPISPTPTPSPTVPPPAGYRDIVINEVNFAPHTNPLSGQPELSYEYVELYNRGEYSVTLEGWHLKDSASLLYNFPSGDASINMHTESFLLIMSSAAQGIFSVDTDLSDGSGRLIAGEEWTEADLTNSGDAVQLYVNPAEDSVSIADFVYYDEVNLGNSTVDAVAVSAGLWSSSSAVDTLGASSSVGRAIYLLVDGQSSHEALGNDQEDQDWGQYPAYYGGSPGYTNPLPPTATPTLTPLPTATPIPTTSPSPHPTAHPLDVVINEIGWMGTGASSYHEYIELYNRSGQEIDLTDWSLNAIDGTPQIALTGTIAQSGYYLLERTSDDPIQDIAADKIYTGGLEDTGETLELKDGSGSVIDTVAAAKGWYAGDGRAISYSMERIDPAIEGIYSWNWRSNDGCLINGLDAGSDPLNATPKSLNSAYYPGAPNGLHLDAGNGFVALNWGAAAKGMFDIAGYNIYRKPSGGSFQKINATPIATITFTDFSVVNGTKYYYYVKTQDALGNESNCSSDELTVTPGAPPPLGDNVIISEVMFNPVGDENLYEWIELFNPTANPIVLDGWAIADTDDGRYTFPLSANFTFQPGDYLILGASQYAVQSGVDVVYNNQSTTEGAIRLNNTEDTVTLFNEQSAQVDQVHYFSNWIREEGHSIVRKAIKKSSNFVELKNIGDHNVDLVGLQLFDGAEIDTLQPYCTNQSVLQPNGYGLVVNNVFFNNYNIQTGTVLVTCGDLAIGNGLTPLDDLILYIRGGTTVVSTFTSSYGVENPPDNTSVERINPQTGDFDANWGLSTDPFGSTPGRKNSITP
jgi:hypothetical protein